MTYRPRDNQHSALGRSDWQAPTATRPLRGPLDWRRPAPLRDLEKAPRTHGNDLASLPTQKQEGRPLFDRPSPYPIQRPPSKEHHLRWEVRGNHVFPRTSHRPWRFPGAPQLLVRDASNDVECSLACQHRRHVVAQLDRPFGDVPLMRVGELAALASEDHPR